MKKLILLSCLLFAGCAEESRSPNLFYYGEKAKLKVSGKPVLITHVFRYHQYSVTYMDDMGEYRYAFVEEVELEKE
jgi:hypothetical protein